MKYATNDEMFKAYKLGKTGDKRLTDKAAKRASRLMRNRRKSKTAWQLVGA